jgi:CBS domain-containing protein
VDWIAAGLPTIRAFAEPRIGEIARRDAPTCQPDEPLAEVAARVRQAGWEVCFVTNAERIVLGRLDRPQLEGAAGTAGEAMKPGPVTYRAHTPVADLAHVMADRGIASLPVTTSDGALIGVVLRQDVERIHADAAGDAESSEELARP